jgi:hypothetical protein
VWSTRRGLLITNFLSFCHILCIPVVLSEDNIQNFRKSVVDATGDGCYAVMDYCPRNLVQMTRKEEITNLPIKFTSDGEHSLVLVTMLQNHEKKIVEMVRQCE